MYLLNFGPSFEQNHSIFQKFCLKIVKKQTNKQTYTKFLHFIRSHSYTKRVILTPVILWPIPLTRSSLVPHTIHTRGCLFQRHFLFLNVLLFWRRGYSRVELLPVRAVPCCKYCHSRFFVHSMVLRAQLDCSPQAPRDIGWFFILFWRQVNGLCSYLNVSLVGIYSTCQA